MFVTRLLLCSLLSTSLQAHRCSEELAEVWYGELVINSNRVRSSMSAR